MTEEGTSASREAIGEDRARSRITFYLPIADKHDEHSINAVIRYLAAKKQSDGVFRSYTYSQMAPAVFTGHYKEPSSEIAADHVVEPSILFVVDTNRHGEGERIKSEVRALREEISSAYQKYGRQLPDATLVIVPWSEPG